METTTIAELVGNLGGMGLAVGIAWYLITKTLPRRDEQFERSLDKISERFSASLEKLQASHKHDTGELAAAVRQLADRVEKNTRVVLGVSMRGVPPDGEATSELARGAGISRPTVETIRRAIRRSRTSDDDTDIIALDALRELDEKPPP